MASAAQMALMPLASAAAADAAHTASVAAKSSRSTLTLVQARARGYNQATLGQRAAQARILQRRELPPTSRGRTPATPPLTAAVAVMEQQAAAVAAQRAASVATMAGLCVP